MKLDAFKNKIPSNFLDNLLHPLDEYPEIDTLGHEYITGDTVLLFSSPPTLKATLHNLKRVNTIGLGSNIMLNSNKTVIPATELNMKYEYFVPGRVNNTINFSRILTSENNILNVFYKWLLEYLEKTFKNNISFLESPYGNNKKHLTSLGSELFLVPFGLIIVELDGLENFVAGFFAENCKILNHSFGVNESPVIIENINIQCQAILPIDTKLKPKLASLKQYMAIITVDQAQKASSNQSTTSSPTNTVQNLTDTDSNTTKDNQKDPFPNKDIVKEESKKQEKKEEEKKKKEEKDRSKSILSFTNKEAAELDESLNKSWDNFQNTIFPDRRLSGFDTENVGTTFNDLA